MIFYPALKAVGSYVRVEHGLGESCKRRCLAEGSQGFSSRYGLVGISSLGYDLAQHSILARMVVLTLKPVCA